MCVLGDVVLLVFYFQVQLFKYRDGSRITSAGRKPCLRKCVLQGRSLSSGLAESKARSGPKLLLKAIQWLLTVRCLALGAQQQGTPALVKSRHWLNVRPGAETGALDRKGRLQAVATAHEAEESCSVLELKAGGGRGAARRQRGGRGRALAGSKPSGKRLQPEERACVAEAEPGRQ